MGYIRRDRVEIRLSESEHDFRVVPMCAGEITASRDHHKMLDIMRKKKKLIDQEEARTLDLVRSTHENMLRTRLGQILVTGLN